MRLIIDKSQDYLLQNSTIVILYLPKSTEGGVITSVAEFMLRAHRIEYVKRDSTKRNSPEFLQKEVEVFHLFRTVCPLDFLPYESDRIYAMDTFWLVERVELTDYDDNCVFQRYRLTCTKTTGPVNP